jgi:hypothetical protein
MPEVLGMVRYAKCKCNEVIEIPVEKPECHCGLTEDARGWEIMGRTVRFVAFSIMLGIGSIYSLSYYFEAQRVRYANPKKIVQVISVPVPQPEAQPEAKPEAKPEPDARNEKALVPEKK